MAANKEQHHGDKPSSDLGAPERKLNSSEVHSLFPFSNLKNAPEPPSDTAGSAED